MTHRTRRTTSLQQLTTIARRAHRWAMIQRIAVPQRQGGVTKHIGRAY